MKERKPSRQRFLFTETQVYATHSTIQRTRNMCIHWGKHTMAGSMPRADMIKINGVNQWYAGIS